jgi:hypothetical protein
VQAVVKSPCTFASPDGMTIFNPGVQQASGFFLFVLSRVRHGISGFFIKFMAVVIKYYRKVNCGYETVFMHSARKGVQTGGCPHSGV